MLRDLPGYGQLAPRGWTECSRYLKPLSYSCRKLSREGHLHRGHSSRPLGNGGESAKSAIPAFAIIKHFSVDHVTCIVCKVKGFAAIHVPIFAGDEVAQL